jgi:hypothetical protein
VRGYDAAMPRSSADVLKRCEERLNRDSVANLLRTYKPERHVTWSASRVLYRLGVTQSKCAMGDVKRRANKILEQLTAEGLLRRKGFVRTPNAHHTDNEIGYVRTSELSA